MEQRLFREEVLQARQSGGPGGIVLAQSVPLWLVTALAAACALAVVLFLALADYTRRTRVTGQLVPSLGLSTVVAPVGGILSDVRVAEGEGVAAGDVLAVLAAPRATLAGGDTSRAVQATLARRQRGIALGHASQRALLVAQQDGLRGQKTLLDAESAQLAEGLATRRAQHRLANETLARFRQLRARQFVTELQVQQQASAALEQAAALQSLEREALALRRQVARIDQELAEIPMRLAQLEATGARDDAALSQEALEAEARAQSVLHAPIDGVVTARLGQSGQSVQAGQPVLSLMPAGGALEAHLLVPSRAVGFIAPGDEVLLRYQAFPYQKFGHHAGRVLRVSRSALGAAELVALGGSGQAAEPVYRVVVALPRPTVRAYGRDEALKPGMLLDADILGERRALWEWAIAPLFALDGRLGRGSAP